MTKIDIFSGFLGAGKTTLIKKLIQEAYAGQQLVLIENEFGEIGVDGGFLQEAGVQITEMNSGCICCSLVGDFGNALRQVLSQYHPDRILIEPSGVGKLSDVIRAVRDLHMEDAQLGGFITVADANKCKLYMKNFGEFFNDQICHAGAIVLSRTAGMSEQKLRAVTALLRELNPEASIITTPWDQLDGRQILEVLERKDTLQAQLAQLAEETSRAHQAEHEAEHHHHDHDHGCCHHDHEEGHGHCHHDHEEHDHECCRHDHEEGHEHHHHDHEGHDHECCHHDHDHDHEHEHEHKHEHHHDHHGHEGHHHADEVFTSWGVETARTFTQEELQEAMEQFSTGLYGAVLRAKGIVAGAEGWLHFDYVPGEIQVRKGPAAATGRLCVIGSRLDEDGLKALFQVD